MSLNCDVVDVDVDVDVVVTIGVTNEVLEISDHWCH